MLSNETIEYWLKRIVRDLVDGNYKKLEEDGLLNKDPSLNEVTSEDIREFIEEYPGIMTIPPQEQFKNFERYDYTIPGDEVASVEFDLWYDGKKSDLMLDLEFIKDGKGGYYGRIYSVYVP